MAKSRSARRMERLLALLKDEMVWAWSTLELARVFEREASTKRDAGLAALIFHSARREAILAAARLASTDQESLTMHYLVDHARNHPQIFRAAPPGDLEQVLNRWDEGWRQWLGFADTLRAHRDRLLAHLDRKVLNEPEALSGLQVRLDEVEGLLEFMLDTLSAIYSLYYHEVLDLGSERRRVRDEGRRLAAFLRPQEK